MGFAETANCGERAGLRPTGLVFNTRLVLNLSAVVKYLVNLQRSDVIMTSYASDCKPSQNIC